MDEGNVRTPTKRSVKLLTLFALKISAYSYRFSLPFFPLPLLLFTGLAKIIEDFGVALISFQIHCFA